MSDPPLLFSPLSFISQEGKTALDIARERKKNECAEVLERHFDREVSRSQHPSRPNPALTSLSFTLSIPWPVSCDRLQPQRQREIEIAQQREREALAAALSSSAVQEKVSSTFPFVLSSPHFSSLSCLSLTGS
jgi:hypothetical protein